MHYSYMIDYKHRVYFTLYWNR